MFKILTIKATLRGVEPIVWRRIEVGEDVTFYQLQKNLQEYFGWPVSKFSVFKTRGVSISQKHGTRLRLESLNSVITRLSVFNFVAKDRIELRQNLMDDWVFDLQIESVGYTEKNGVLSCVGYGGTTPPINYSGPNEFELFSGKARIPQVMGTLQGYK